MRKSDAPWNPNPPSNREWYQAQRALLLHEARIEARAAIRASRIVPVTNTTVRLTGPAPLLNMIEAAAKLRRWRQNHQK